MGDGPSPFARNISHTPNALDVRELFNQVNIGNVHRSRAVDWLQLAGNSWRLLLPEEAPLPAAPANGDRSPEDASERLALEAKLIREYARMLQANEHLRKMPASLTWPDVHHNESLKVKVVISATGPLPERTLRLEGEQGAWRDERTPGRSPHHNDPGAFPMPEALLKVAQYDYPGFPNDVEDPRRSPRGNHIYEVAPLSIESLETVDNPEVVRDSLLQEPRANVFPREVTEGTSEITPRRRGDLLTDFAMATRRELQSHAVQDRQDGIYSMLPGTSAQNDPVYGPVGIRLPSNAGMPGVVTSRKESTSSAGRGQQPCLNKQGSITSLNFVTTARRESQQLTGESDVCVASNARNGAAHSRKLSAGSRSGLFEASNVRAVGRDRKSSATSMGGQGRSSISKASLTVGNHASDDQEKDALFGTKTKNVSPDSWEGSSMQEVNELHSVVNGLAHDQPAGDDSADLEAHLAALDDILASVQNTDFSPEALSASPDAKGIQSPPENKKDPPDKRKNVASPKYAKPGAKKKKKQTEHQWSGYRWE